MLWIGRLTLHAVCGVILSTRATGSHHFQLAPIVEGLPEGTASAWTCGEGRRRFLRLQYTRSEEHTSELQSRGHLVCRLLLEKKKDRQRRRRQRNGHGIHQ